MSAIATIIPDNHNKDVEYVDRSIEISKARWSKGLGRFGYSKTHINRIISRAVNRDRFGRNENHFHIEHINLGMHSRRLCTMSKGCF